SHMDAANVDLKAFTEAFYHKLCAGHLQPVLDTLEYLLHETGVWTEITTLLIPGSNDSDMEIRQENEWIMEHLGADIPWHFSAFHPDYKMMDTSHTPASTLSRARRIALDAGLHHVYTGNVHDTDGGTTSCPNCGNKLIVRDWYDILDYQVTDDGRCPSCGTGLPGRFSHFDHAYGNHRMPVRIAG
ncbi:MAG: AmmeMemoRadiSam system radical SAM enzyme, partial [Mariprofundaceae bacterium]|nr:AmmeMemoRadiSam system radical SAM enzyme [Mariprofundaceae bacterium]